MVHRIKKIKSHLLITFIFVSRQQIIQTHIKFEGEVAIINLTVWRSATDFNWSISFQQFFSEKKLIKD